MEYEPILGEVKLVGRLLEQYSIQSGCDHSGRVKRFVRLRNRLSVGHVESTIWTAIVVVTIFAGLSGWPPKPWVIWSLPSLLIILVGALYTKARIEKNVQVMELEMRGLFKKIEEWLGTFGYQALKSSEEQSIQTTVDNALELLALRVAHFKSEGDKLAELEWSLQKLRSAYYLAEYFGTTPKYTIAEYIQWADKEYLNPDPNCRRGQWAEVV